MSSSLCSVATANVFVLCTGRDVSINMYPVIKVPVKPALLGFYVLLPHTVYKQVTKIDQIVVSTTATIWCFVHAFSICAMGLL